LNEIKYTSFTGRKHFHTFDALRFFAFLKVFLLHLPVVAFPVFNYLKAGGGLGVHFFFVLSGFLITYIIYEEKLRMGSLDLKNFFMRRLLRIWPLFYFMLLVAFVTPIILSKLHLPSSSEGYEPNWLMSVLFLENYNIMIHGGEQPNVSPLGNMWSLCVEEHFYIIWGLLLFFARFKYLPVILISCIIIAPVCRLIYFNSGIPASDLFTNIDLFAYGALPAYFLLKDGQRLEERINSVSLRWKQIFVVFLLSAVVISSQYAKDEGALILITSFLGLLFSILIAFILPTNTRFRIRDENIFSRLGIYTYGLYLFHSLAINLVKQLASKFHWEYDGHIIPSIVFVLICLLVTIICSYLSYHLFEKQFLKLKQFFRRTAVSKAEPVKV
jgi:peptidoglycan/LPS O-acetylase OafA/YrhL